MSTNISCFFHDAACCLLKDGVLVAAVEEERFSRQKHDAGIPKHGFNYCLEEDGLTIDESRLRRLLRGACEEVIQTNMDDAWSAL